MGKSRAPGSTLKIARAELVIELIDLQTAATREVKRGLELLKEQAFEGVGELEDDYKTASRLLRRALPLRRALTGRDRGPAQRSLRDRARVKCLHAHYAHFLATRANPVGEWVHERLPEAIQRLCPPAARTPDE